MATEVFSVTHPPSKTVFFRFHDTTLPDPDSGGTVNTWDFTDPQWEISVAACNDPNLEATEKTDIAGASNSTYTASYNMATINNTPTPKRVLVAAYDDLASDEIIGAEEITIVSGEVVTASNVLQLLGTTLTETSAGYLTAAFKKLFDVVTPVLTAASVDQTGDGYAIVNHATYGNAKLVRSTAPANTLDVSATGEAGLDFDNIKAATGATTLTNITVPTVTTLTGHTAQTGDSYVIVAHASYGNALLVRSTTPANTLDVSADGEAGVDWANVGSPTTTVALTNTTINTDAGWDLAGKIDGKTPAESLQIISATTSGKVSGARSGTEVFKGLDASTTRVTVSADTSGNRTSVTYA